MTAFKFAFCSNVFEKKPLNYTLDVLVREGYDGVELMGKPPHIDLNIPIKKLLNDLKKMLDEHELSVPCVSAFSMPIGDGKYGYSWISTRKIEREARLEYTLKMIDIASVIGADSVSTLGGGIVTEYAGSSLGKEVLKELFFNSLGCALEKAEVCNINLLIEISPGLLIGSSKDLLELINYFNSTHLKILFDIGHMRLIEENFLDGLKMLSKYIHHVHLKDIKDEQHKNLLPGDGIIDFDKVFKTLNEINYRGFVCFEPLAYKDKPELAAEQSLKRAKTILSK